MVLIQRPVRPETLGFFSTTPLHNRHHFPGSPPCLKSMVRPFRGARLGLRMRIRESHGREVAHSGSNVGEQPPLAHLPRAGGGSNLRRWASPRERTEGKQRVRCFEHPTCTANAQDEQEKNIFRDHEVWNILPRSCFQ